MVVSFWVWWIFAAILFGLEILAPGVFFLWVAIGALAAGLLALGVPELTWEINAIVMVAVAILAAILGRRFYQTRRSETVSGPLNRRGERLVGRTATLVEPIVNGIGKVQLDGSWWQVTGPDLPTGVVVIVIGADGTSLRVEAG